jgi:hypothetical protein
MQTAPAAMSAAVDASGTVATPSHALHGALMANATPVQATHLFTPTRSSARNTASTPARSATTATHRATASDRPQRIIAPPFNQNGKGSQLVPLGSSFGA